MKDVRQMRLKENARGDNTCSEEFPFGSLSTAEKRVDAAGSCSSDIGITISLLHTDSSQLTGRPGVGKDEE